MSGFWNIFKKRLTLTNQQELMYKALICHRCEKYKRCWMNDFHCLHECIVKYEAKRLRLAKEAFKRGQEQ